MKTDSLRQKSDFSSAESGFSAEALRVRKKYPADRFDSTLEESMAVLSRMRGYYSWLASILKPHMGTRILDIGCADGNLTSFFLKKGLFVVGMDKHLPTLKLFKRKSADHPGTFAKQGDICDPHDVQVLKKACFDTIISSNVLEHIRDDRLALRHMSEILVPGGRLCLIVPGVRFLHSRIDNLIGHYRRYSLPDLTAKVGDAGFRIVKRRYLNLPGALGWLLVHRGLGVKRFNPFWFGLFNLLMPFFRTLERFAAFPAGMSVILIAEKPAPWSRDGARPPGDPGEKTGSS